MARERLKSPRARLFVALDLPDRVREGLVDWQRAELAGEPALRAVAPEALHMTLAFLGYRRQRDVEAIAAAALAIEPAPVGLELLPDPVPVPPRGRPRLLAIDAPSEAAMALQAALAARLEAEGFYEPERRPFWPHVTVARVRPEGRGARRPAIVGRLPGRLGEALCAPFYCVRLTLYRSVLRHQGAEYTPMAQIELPAGDGSGKET